MKDQQQQCCFKLAQSSRWIELKSVPFTEESSERNLQRGIYTEEHTQESPHRAIKEEPSQKNLEQWIFGETSTKAQRLKVMCNSKWKSHIDQWEKGLLRRHLNKRNSLKECRQWPMKAVMKISLKSFQKPFLPKVFSGLFVVFGDQQSLLIADPGHSHEEPSDRRDRRSHNHFQIVFWIVFQISEFLCKWLEPIERSTVELYP